MSDSLGSYLARQGSNKYSSPSQPSNPSSNHSSPSGTTIPSTTGFNVGTTSPSTNTYLPTTTPSYSDPYKPTAPTYTPQQINLDNSFVLFAKPTPMTTNTTTTTTTTSYTTSQPSSLYQTPQKTVPTTTYTPYQPQTTSYSSQPQSTNYSYKPNIDYNFNIFDEPKPSSTHNPITTTTTTNPTPIRRTITNPMRMSTMRQSTIRHLSENQQQETVQSQATSLLKILGLEALTDESTAPKDSEGQPSFFSALFGSTPLAHSVDQNDKNPLYFFDQEYAQERKDIKQLDYKKDNKENDSLEAQERERLKNNVFAFFCQPNHEFAKFLVLLSQMNSKREKFVDKDFPASQNSLMGKNYSRTSEWGDCVWLSPDEFYGKNNYQVFVGGIEIGDIHQGKLGNCYFLSTLTLSLRHFFQTKKIKTSAKTTSIFFQHFFGLLKKISMKHFFVPQKFFKARFFLLSRSALNSAQTFFDFSSQRSSFSLNLMFLLSNKIIATVVRPISGIPYFSKIVRSPSMGHATRKVLSSLAEWPDRIQKLFATKERNDAGCYCVKICEMGEWKEVMVDDLFPCVGKTRKPIFTSGNDHELWVLILEKVWAKVYGSYDAIEDGLTRECLHDLTGAPTTYFFTDRKAEWETIWKRLVNAEKNNFVMTCGTAGFGQEDVNAQGIVASHAYSLISAFEEFDRSGKKVRLLKIRNPWGDVEWNGDWSDSCPNWTPELRAKYSVEKKDDGIFYISYEDFLKQFDDIQICFVHDNYQYNSLRKTVLPKQGSYFIIKIDKAGRYYITVNQESKRKHAYNLDWKYSIVYFRIYRIAGQGEYKLITGRNGADKEVWTDVKCEPGNYIVFVQVDWLSKNNDFVLSTYGPSLTQITVTSKQEHPQLYD